MKHHRIQYITSAILKIKYLGSVNKGQEIKEGLKQWKEGGKESERKGGQEGQREEQTNLSPPHW